MRNWFDTSAFKQHHVNLGLQDYYAKHFPGRNIQKDVPLTCPPAEHMQLLLERSLAKERQLWPPHLVEAWQVDHVAAFDKAIASHKFCWINVNATLEEQPHWKAWFTSLQSLEDLPVTLPQPLARQPQQRQQRRTRPPRVVTAAPTAAPTTVLLEEDGDGDGQDSSHYYYYHDGGEDGGDDGSDGEGYGDRGE